MTKPDLTQIRQDIDRIDDAIAALLGERSAATAQVRAQKSDDGSIASSPIRPAREAEILRRIIAQRAGDLPPDLLVRLWRTILVSSTLSQAPVKLHTVACSIEQRMLLNDHFGPMPVLEHKTEAQVLTALAISTGDIAALPTSLDWPGTMPENVAVIATLPVLKSPGPPSILVFGHAEAQPSGDDVTIVIGFPAKALRPLWKMGAAGRNIFALPGFLSEADVSSSANPGYRIAGRCPAPIEV